MIADPLLGTYLCVALLSYHSRACWSDTVCRCGAIFAFYVETRLFAGIDWVVVTCRAYHLAWWPRACHMCLFHRNCHGSSSLQLEQHSMIWSAWPGHKQTVVDVVEEGDLAVARGPHILQLFCGMVVRRFDGELYVNTIWLEKVDHLLLFALSLSIV